MKKYFLILFIVAGFSIANYALAAVAYDNSSKGSCVRVSNGCTSNFNQLTFSHTTGSGSNRGLAVGCTVSGPSATVVPDISTVTYAGVSLSQLAKLEANYDTYIWTLANGVQPATGANNVVVTLVSGLGGDNDTITCAAISATGVNQTTTWTVSNATNAASASQLASSTLSASGANDMVVAFLCAGTSIGTTNGALVSRQQTNSSAVACASFGGATAVGGTTALSWNVNAASADKWQMLGAAFKSSDIRRITIRGAKVTIIGGAILIRGK